MERNDDVATKQAVRGTHEAPSDAELLLRLRGGDGSAYEALWSRHIGAALRLARRLDRDRAEDLASEAFLAVYRQITTTSAGPTEAFRAYLFTVIRNTATRWGREHEKLSVLPEIERINPEDGLSIVSREAGAAEVLSAFRELPERWQRVLWLSEVDEVPRPRIAAELRIRPNAVSSLHRRARTGLLQLWLARQVPDALRADRSHEARLLPDYVIGSLAAADRIVAEAHLASCGACTELLGDLRSSASVLQKAALSSIGFAALGTTLPAASPLPVATAVGGAALLLGAASQAGAAGAATGIGIAACGAAVAVALVVGGLSATSSGTGHGTPPQKNSSTTAQQAAPADLAPPASATPRQAGRSEASPGRDPLPTPDPSPEAAPTPGRHNTDGSIKEISLTDGWTEPSTPGPTRPSPRPPGTGTDPSTEPTALDPGVRTPSSTSGYFAPVIAGRTSPGSQVTVALSGRQYAAPVSPTGEWSFDLRAFEVVPGSYTYQVWAYTDTLRSAAVSGSYTLVPVAIRGFEDALTIDVSEARTTGLVLAFQGPKGGSICLQSMAGQVASVPLDATGNAVRRLRLNAGGFYMFTFRACSGAFVGPGTETYATVDDPDAPIFGPWGPDPAEQTFELSEI